MDFKKILEMINTTYTKAFGKTPLIERLDDIMGEALELRRYSNVQNLREEFGDILTSVLRGIHEQGWNPEVLIKVALGEL